MKQLMIIKPDANHLAKPILTSLIEEHHLQVIGLKTLRISQSDAEALYANESHQYFHQTLISYMQQGDSIIVALESDDSLNLKPIKKSIRAEFPSIDNHKIAEIRSLNPTIGESFIEETKATYDTIHGSDPGDGNDEVDIFFKASEISLKPITVAEIDHRVSTTMQGIDVEEMLSLIEKKMVAKPCENKAPQTDFFQTTITLPQTSRDCSYRAEL